MHTASIFESIANLLSNPGDVPLHFLSLSPLWIHGRARVRGCDFLSKTENSSSALRCVMECRRFLLYSSRRARPPFRHVRSATKTSTTTTFRASQRRADKRISKFPAGGSSFNTRYALRRLSFSTNVSVFFFFRSFFTRYRIFLLVQLPLSLSLSLSVSLSLFLFHVRYLKLHLCPSFLGRLGYLQFAKRFCNGSNRTVIYVGESRQPWAIFQFPFFLDK